jgi:hypothetical protein
MKVWREVFSLIIRIVLFSFNEENFKEERFKDGKDNLFFSFNKKSHVK